MKFVTLIVGLVFGFLFAAWFYDAGGALVIAGKQIEPDVLASPYFHSNTGRDFSSEKGAVNNPEVAGKSGFSTGSGTGFRRAAVALPGTMSHRRQWEETSPHRE